MGRNHGIRKRSSVLAEDAFRPLPPPTQLEDETVPILAGANYSQGNRLVSTNNNQAIDHYKTEDALIIEEESDGGWGWIVVLSSFLCNMLLDGIGYSFGVLLEPMRKDLQCSSGSISFVGSILAGVIMLTGPISAISVNRLGSRLTCMIGSVLAAAAIFGSSFSEGLPGILISYGVLGGLGLGLIYLPSVVTVGQYFNKKLSLATGICVCGSGVGTFVFAPLAAALVDAYGWRGSNRVMAGLCLLCSVFGLVFVPKSRSSAVPEGREEVQPEEKKSFNFAILKNTKFLLVMLGNVPTLMAVYAVFSHLPAMSLGLGLTITQSSTLISAIGITNTVGRILCGWLTDLPCVSPLVVTIIASALGGTVPILMPFCGSYYLLLVLCAIFGFIISALPTVTSALIVDLLGKENLNSAFGALTFVRGTAAFLGPPLAGYLADITSSHTTSFAFSSCELGLSAAIHFVVFLLQLRERRMPKSDYTAI